MHESYDIFAFLKTLGGLAIFLLGLDFMSTNLKRTAGGTLKLILRKATANPFIGVLIGTVVTMVIQSSSATTSILVSFVQSQLITFEHSIAVLMGANIGTTITAQIVAFKVGKLAFGIISAGFLVNSLSRRSVNKYIGGIILGLGLLFLGLNLMSASLHSLRSAPFFLELMQSLENIPLGILVGAIFTALVQSSSAAIGIMIGMASQGLVSVEAAFPIILGANLGTCITAVLASLKSNSSGRRVATAHVLFNVAGIVLFMFWIPQFINLIKLFTDVNDVPRMIANGQTIFNVITTLILFPFIGVINKVSCKIIPASQGKKSYSLPRASNLLQSPSLLLIQSKDSILYMERAVRKMLWLTRTYLITEDDSVIEEFKDLRSEQKELRGQTLDFLNRIGKCKLTYDEVNRMLNQTTLINEIEHIAAQIESAFETNEHTIQHNDEEYLQLDKYFKYSIKNFKASCKSLLYEDLEKTKFTCQQIENLKLKSQNLRQKMLERISSDETKYSSHDEELTLRIIDLLNSINNGSLRICEINLNLQQASY